MRTELKRGFTLIELVIVITIVGLVLGLGALGIGALRGPDVGATGSVLSGAMTYLASRAVQDNTTYRLVIDMDAQRFYTEAANDDDPCARFMPDDDLDFMDHDDDPDAPRGQFSQRKERLLQRKFQPATNVTGVLTSHHTEVQHEGRAAIYFYPNGRAERALVWVGGEEGKDPPRYTPEITLELHGLGTVTWHGTVVDERAFDLSEVEAIR